MTLGAIERTRRAVAVGAVSAVEIVSEALRRIDAYDGALGSVVALRAEEALSEARLVDARIARGDETRVLAGVPMLVKDNEDVVGLPTRRGSTLLRDAPPARSFDAAPGRLREAGAIVIGKTNLPEFAIEGFTDNLLCGPTRNPWSLAHSPGGSSGGSAAALSAGLVPIATATDGGGSVRIPAALCGLVGLKPTTGAVGRWPVHDWIDLSTPGPLATTVSDLRLLFRQMTGVVHGDPSSAPFPGTLRSGKPSKILVAERTSPLGPLPQSVAMRFKDAVARAAQLWDAEVIELVAAEVFGDIGDPDTDWFTLAPAEHVAALGRSWVLDGLTSMHPSSRAFFEAGLEVHIDEYLACRRRRTDYTRRLDELLGADAVLLTPTFALESLLADGRRSAESEWAPTGPDVYSTAVQNITGHPAICVPAGNFESGIPFGLQITAPRWSDLWLLDLVGQWERAFPWQRTATGYAEFGA